MDRPTPLSLRSFVTPVTNFVLPIPLSLPLSFCYHSSILHPSPTIPIPVPVSFFNFADREVVFSRSSRTVEILNLRSSCCLALSTSLSRLSIAVFSFFHSSFFLSSVFPLKENLPCDRAKSARAFYVPDDPYGIVSRTSARTGVETDLGILSERGPGTMKLRSDDKPISRAGCGPDELFCHYRRRELVTRSVELIRIARINTECTSGCIKLCSIIENGNWDTSVRIKK